jgi:NAD(P)-dependent dehydrogenase (short-subunit alcohol dehydrogenase family)
MDVTKEEDIARAAAEVEGLFGPQCVRLLFNVSGVLHAEKSLAQVSSGTLHSHFLVNAFGPILTTKHFAGKKLLYGAAPKREFAEGPVRWEGSVVANMSARTGSIGDNRLGGWYSYRASKCELACQALLLISLTPSRWLVPRQPH